MSRRRKFPDNNGAEMLKAAERARALVREQLKHGPRAESSVMAAAEAADILDRSLVVAADALGVRSQKGQWRLPG